MSIGDMTIDSLYDLEQTIAADLFKGQAYPWKVLPLIKDYIMALGSQLSFDEYDLVDGNVWIAKSAKVAPTAYIQGPAIICKEAEINEGKVDIIPFSLGKVCFQDYCIFDERPAAYVVNKLLNTTKGIRQSRLHRILRILSE